MSREPSPEVPRLHLPSDSRTSLSAGHTNAVVDGRNSDSPNSPNGPASAKPSPSRSYSRSVPNANGTLRAGSAAAAAGAAPTISASQPRSSAASAAASQVRPSSVAAGSVARTSAAGSQARPVQPSVPRPPASCTAPSLARTTGMATPRQSVASAGAGGAAGAIKASVMSSTMPEGQFAGVSGDVAKYLKDLIRRRDEGVYLRVLPKHQQLVQLVAQEAAARELAVQQEQTGRLMVVHKAHEERAKKREQEIARQARDRTEALKRAQLEELAAQKRTVAALQAETDREVRERLSTVQALHPKLNPTSAALADVKNEQSACAVLAALLEETKKVQKALKGNARHAKSKNAETDGGAVPFWLKDCIAASFNVAAILAGSPHRASVMDAPSVASKAPADKKVLVVRATDAAGAPIVAWAHTRVAVPDAASATAALLPIVGANAEDGSHNDAALAIAAPPECGAAAAFAQVVWPREDCAAVMKLAKGPNATCGCLQTHTVASLSYGGVTSHEFTAKDIAALGEAASQ